MASRPERSCDVRRMGDSALVVSFEERIAPAVNARAVELASSLRRKRPAGVRDIVESYCAVTLHVDPLTVDLDHLTSVLEVEAERAALSPRGVEEGREINVPVCYDGEYAPDLSAVAAAAGCGEADVVRRHSALTYRVYMLGFLPGFAYMASVDPTIAVPRRSSPRLRVPAGSVGIAGPQTGVYPFSAPGGWQLIGRTPLSTLDLDRPDPFLFHPGDSVRFEPVNAATFAELSSSR